MFEYLLSGKYCDGASKERNRTIRKKALKFSVSSGRELFYRQKGRARQVPFAAVCRVKLSNKNVMHVYTGIVVSLVCELTIHNYCKVVYVIVSHSCLTSQYVFFRIAFSYITHV